MRTLEQNLFRNPLAGQSVLGINPVRYWVIGPTALLGSPLIVWLILQRKNLQKTMGT